MLAIIPFIFLKNMKYSMLTFSTKYSRAPKSDIALKYHNFIMASWIKPVVIEKEAYQTIVEGFYIQSKKMWLQVLACNILPDHVHLLIQYNDQDITAYVRKIKWYSAFLYNQKFKKTKKWWGRQYTLRGRKYNQTMVNSLAHKRNSMRYINTNHYKHAEKRWKHIIKDYNTHLKNKLIAYGRL